jgi:oligopeptide/dipeptide ABC transporter ATP-binding protein
MLLDVKNLSIRFNTDAGQVEAVRSVCFTLHEGETLGVVGESGCGKSVVNLALMGLLPPEARVTAERLNFERSSLLSLRPNQWQKIRGSGIAMIFQDPMTSLNPCFTVGAQLDEAIHLHHPLLSKKERRCRSIELLEQVGILDPTSRLSCYPHELSGGMAQRIMIAIALAGEPRLLIADEPTTALDVTIQDQILKLLRSLQRYRNMALILVTHDLAVAANNTDRIQVMYAGEIVESGRTIDLLRNPAHPYTKGLLRSLPSQNTGGFRSQLDGIPGNIPSLINRQSRCQFSDRCTKARSRCFEENPKLELNPRHPEREIRCFFAGDTCE